MVVVSGCGSSSRSSSIHAPATTTNSSVARFQAGPDPCRLVTPQVILTTTAERMVRVSRSKSSCSYMNAARTDNVAISTAKTSRAGAEAAVSGTVGTVKARVQHLGGVGDSAVAYLTTTKSRSIATCLFTKNGTLVFVNVSGPQARGLVLRVTALAKAAAGRTQ
jgi:hypothetical protein